jgi:RHS repeat-associated protein
VDSLGKRSSLNIIDSIGFPFGLGSIGVYHFWFNGKELDEEGMGGGGSTYDYGFRIYNAQLGKFLSVDPLIQLVL